MSEKPNFLDYVNVYDFDCELPGSKEIIKFKPLTTGQIKKLLTYENETNYVVQEQALDGLVSSSVLSDGFDIGELYIYDRLFLLLEIRKKTKGEILEFQLNCDKCNSQSLQRVNLDQLEIIEPENLDDVIVELSNGIKVHLRHMKRKNQKQEMLPRYFPKNATDRQLGYLFQVLFHACAINKIETPSGIDEDLSIKDKIYFVEEIPMLEMEKVQRAVDSMGFGWKLEYQYNCVHCKHENKDMIPIQQNFFG